jgi:hypothetical protein
VPATNFEPISISVSSMNFPPAAVACRLFR